MFSQNTFFVVQMIFGLNDKVIIECLFQITYLFNSLILKVDNLKLFKSLIIPFEIFVILVALLDKQYMIYALYFHKTFNIIENIVKKCIILFNQQEFVKYCFVQLLIISYNYIIYNRAILTDFVRIRKRIKNKFIARQIIFYNLKNFLIKNI